MFALKRTSLGSVLDCVAPCLEESLLSLAKLRLEEVWKSFTEHTKCRNLLKFSHLKSFQQSLDWILSLSTHATCQEGNVSMSSLKPSSLLSGLRNFSQTPGRSNQAG